VRRKAFWWNEIEHVYVVLSTNSFSPKFLGDAFEINVFFLIFSHLTVGNAFFFVLPSHFFLGLL